MFPELLFRGAKSRKQGCATKLACACFYQPKNKTGTERCRHSPPCDLKRAGTTKTTNHVAQGEGGAILHKLATNGTLKCVKFSHDAKIIFTTKKNIFGVGKLYKSQFEVKKWNSVRNESKWSQVVRKHSSKRMQGIQF